MEKKELERKQSYRSDAKQTSSPSAPPVSMLPPRPTFQKKKTASPSSSASTPEDSDPLSASSNHLKLVHAPIIPAEEPKVGDHDICRHQVDSDDDFGPRDDDDHLEASLELPSQVRHLEDAACLLCAQSPKEKRCSICRINCIKRTQQRSAVSRSSRLCLIKPSCQR